MTDALPFRRVIDSEGDRATVLVTDADLGEIRVVMAARVVGTPAGDEIIRRALARRATNRDVAQSGGD